MNKRADESESSKLNMVKQAVERQRAASTAKEVLTEFCESSTIHGMKYLGRRPMGEK